MNDSDATACKEVALLAMNEIPNSIVHHLDISDDELERLHQQLEMDMEDHSR